MPRVAFLLVFGLAGLARGGALAPAAGACCPEADGPALERVCCCVEPAGEARRLPPDASALRPPSDDDAADAPRAPVAPALLAPPRGFSPDAARIWRPPPTLLAARTSFLR